MKYDTTLALMAAVRTYVEWGECSVHIDAHVINLVTFLRRFTFCLYEDRECQLLIDDGFYLHLAEDPIYETK